MPALQDVFGYGERTPQVMGAIIGRIPDYEVAALPNHRLFVQHIRQIPSRVQDILAVNRTDDEMRDLRIHAAAFDTSPGSFVPGLIYRDVTIEEVALVNNYEIEGLWFTHKPNQLVVIGSSDGETTYFGVADAHTDPQGELTFIKEPFEGLFPPPLNDPARTIEIAEIARVNFLSS